MARKNTKVVELLTVETVAAMNKEALQGQLALMDQAIEKNANDTNAIHNKDIIEQRLAELESAEQNDQEQNDQEQNDQEQNDQEQNNEPKQDMGAQVKAILDDETLSDTEKWARIARLSASQIDETKLPLDQCSDAELLRRLKLVWSKKTHTKKAIEGSQAMYDQELENMKEINKLIEEARIAEADGQQPAYEIAKLEENLKKSGDQAEAFRQLIDKWQKDWNDLIAKETEIGSFRKEGSKGPKAGVVSGDSDPSKLSQADLGKYIRNLQSKKCSAKKSGKKDEEAKWQAKIEEAIKFRDGADNSSATTQKVNDMTAKIKETITALEALPQSEAVTKQIEQLKALLQ